MVEGLPDQPRITHDRCTLVFHGKTSMAYETDLHSGASLSVMPLGLLPQACQLSID
jgi:hypothetical protein